MVPNFPLPKETSPLNSLVYPFWISTLDPTLINPMSSPHRVSFTSFSDPTNATPTNFNSVFTELDFSGATVFNVLHPDNGLTGNSSINDAPALVQADLGIAIGAGTNVAIESAGIILMRNDPRDISKIIRLSELTYKKMLQNLFWAAGYNVLAIPIAAGVLASQGILLQPAVAAIFMSASTVIVAVNALLLRNKKLS